MELNRIRPLNDNTCNGTFILEQFTEPGVYFVEGKYDGMKPSDSGPGSPPGAWHFHIHVAPDGSGQWINLDGSTSMKYGPGEAPNDLLGCAVFGDPVYRVS